MKDLLPGAAAIRWWMESFQALAAAKTLDELVRRLPRGPLRRSLGTAAEVYHANPRPFFFEASLDNAYYAELLARAHALFLQAAAC